MDLKSQQQVNSKRQSVQGPTELRGLECGDCQAEHNLVGRTAERTQNRLRQTHRRRLNFSTKPATGELQHCQELLIDGMGHLCLRRIHNPAVDDFPGNDCLSQGLFVEALDGVW